MLITPGYKWFLSLFLIGLLGCTEVPDDSPDTTQPIEKQINVNLVSCPEYPAEFSLIEVDDPLAEQNQTYRLQPQSIPEIGHCMVEPQFGTHLQRVTAIDGYNGRHEYSRVDAFNADHSMILLITEEGTQKVFRTSSLPYNQTSNLVMEINAMEPRWDPVDPQLIWAMDGFQIISIHTEDLTTQIIKDFTQDPDLGEIISSCPAYRITSMDEGESSLDKRYWAFAIQGDDRQDYHYLRLFTWDREKDVIMGIYPPDRSLRAEEADIDWIGMSPLGEWVLIGGLDSNQGEIVGLTLSDKKLAQFHPLDHTTAHADTGLDCSGREVIVMQNTQTDTIDMIPLDPNMSADLNQDGTEDNNGRVPLIRLNYNSDSPDGLNSGVHISCNTPCYCVISTTIAPGLPEQNWLDRSIVLVKLDPEDPSVFYLSKLHNTTSEEPRVYWDETHASITRDGSRIIWADNWGENVGESAIFLMELTMPEEWQFLFEK